ncbi:MAG TPA: putative dsRNA-binding protein, partial [Stellaceae bacterium]|nr:putative dsRNA-binding protein [Stellaceae bacterium]
LQEWAQGRGLGLPVYETVDVAGPAHKRVFTVSARIEGAEPATASGSSKRAAETAAAAELIARLAGEPTRSRPS